MTNSKSKRKPRPDKSKPGTAAAPRVTRPALPRTEPIRSWSTLFGPDTAAARMAQGTAESAQAASSPVQRGVELGYRVVEEYMRQGAAAASSFSQPDRGTPGLGDLSQMTERMLRTSQDFAASWFEMMSSVMSATGSASGSGEAPAPWSPNRQPGSAPAAQPSVRGRTTVRIEASRSTEVTLSLDAPVSGPLVVEPLRAGPAAPAIAGVSVSLATDGSGDLEVRAAVPPEVRPDRYTGALFDQANRPVGRLTIAVLG